MDPAAQQEQLLDAGGYTVELASQALAATGSRSTLKATEWILNQRRSMDVAARMGGINAGAGGGKGGGMGALAGNSSQSKLDYFYQRGGSGGGDGGLTSHSSLQLRVAPAPAREDFVSVGLPHDSSEGNSTDTSGQEYYDEGKDAPSATLSATRGVGVGVGVRARAGAATASGAGAGGVLGYPGGTTRSSQELLYDMVRVGSGSVVRDDEVAAAGGGTSATKLKRAYISPSQNQAGGGGGGGDGCGPGGVKRLKHSGIEAPPAAPIEPPSFRQSGGVVESKRQNITTTFGRNKGKDFAPLAERMRPATIGEVVGQEHLLGPRHVLRTLLDNDTVPSMILYGPPGTGKTSLARAIARTRTTSASGSGGGGGLRFVSLSAVNSGTKEVKEALDEAAKRRKYGQRTLLFLDEVHRFNKAQQDLFLPAVEAGDIIFVGATTENPSFEINSALLSRCRVLTLLKLEPEDVRKVLERALGDRERGVLASLQQLPPGPATASDSGSGAGVGTEIGECSVRVEDEALTFLAGAADGDARVALNAFEMATVAAYSEAKQLRPKLQTQQGQGQGHGQGRGQIQGQQQDGMTTGTTPPVSKLSIRTSPPIPGGPMPMGTDHRVAIGGSSGVTVNAKRLEALMETVKENNFNSTEDYTKPFKKFVGGKEVTQLHNPSRFDREVASLTSNNAGTSVLTGAGAGAAGNAGSGRDDMSSLLRLEEFTTDDNNTMVDTKGSLSPDAIVPDGAAAGAGGTGGENLESSPSGSGLGSGIVVRVTLALVRESFQRSHVLYDKTGEEHYNLISALHKSMRGGDADAALYWLARMLEGGEGPLYVARRLIRFASEDVGMADPYAMGTAVACYQACHFLGMPECNVNLAQCVVYLACAPKSVVVYQGIEAAQKLVRESEQNEPVPLHLRNAPTKLMKDMGYGKGYVYPPGHVERVEQEYMPPSLEGHKFLRWQES